MPPMPAVRACIIYCIIGFFSPHPSSQVFGLFTPSNYDLHALLRLTLSCMAFMIIWQVHYKVFHSMNYDKTNTWQEQNTKWDHKKICTLLPGMKDPGHHLSSAEKHVLGHCSVQHQ